MEPRYNMVDSGNVCRANGLPIMKDWRVSKHSYCPRARHACCRAALPHGRALTQRQHVSHDVGASRRGASDTIPHTYVGG